MSAAAPPLDVDQIPREDVGFLSMMKRTDVRTLSFSRAAGKLAGATVSYGTMVYIAQAGGAQWQVSLVAASSYLSAVLFGIQGGSLADAMSKRVALIGGYISLAMLCILFPRFFGTSVNDLVVIMFLSSALMQVVSPSLKAAVAIVANPAELATVATVVNLAGSIASAIGSSVLAPVLIKRTSLDTLLMIAGLIYLAGAIWTRKMKYPEETKTVMGIVKSVEWKTSALSRQKTAQWMWDHLDVGTVILVGAIVVSMYEAFNTLIPVYVRDVLHTDPTNAVYIFAPAGIGFLFATFLTPYFIRLIGARRVAIAAAVIMGVSFMGFAFVDQLAPLLAPLSPLHLISWAFDTEISKVVLAASTIAVPANFGSTAAGSAVQTFINANVPQARQGATFGIQEVQENILTLFVVLALGIVSTAVGPKIIFVVAPMITILLVGGLIRYSFKVGGEQSISMRAAVGELMGDDAAIDASRTDPPKE